MKTRTLIAPGVIALLTLFLWAPPAVAYETYSAFEVVNPDGNMEPVGNCKTCHGHFRATNAENSNSFLRDEYVSPTDGKTWDEIYQEVNATEPDEEVGLHDVHRHIMVDKLSRSRCDVCHISGGRYPVYLNFSATDDLAPIGCVGCHGRQEDADNGAGLGAGLRQHHTNAGVNACKSCHADADPANYTPVGENVLPPNYFSPDPEFPNKPTDPCNKNGAEDYAGGHQGLDNDGDGKYDQGDFDCRGFGNAN